MSPDPLSISSLSFSLYKSLVLRVLINKEVFVSISKKKKRTAHRLLICNAEKKIFIFVPKNFSLGGLGRF